MRTNRRLAVMALAASFILGGCASTNRTEDMIEITFDREDSSSANVTYGDSRAVIDVTDPWGINGLNANLVEGEWPEEVVVRLRLRGLERLEIHYGNYTIATGVSSTGDPDPPLTLTVIDEQGRTQSASPSAYVYYPDIRRTTNGFEITLPPHFHSDHYPSFSMQWIDFYR
jgi:hypothetical protein